MIVNWLIEDSVYGDDISSVIAEIRKQGFSFKLHNYSALDGDKFLNLFNKDDCVIFYGSLKFSRILNKQAPWIPGVYCNLPKYECTYYYPYFGEYLLNNKY